MKLSRKQKEYQKIVGLRFGAVFAAVVALMWTGIFASFLGGTSQKIALAVLLSAGVLALALSLYLLIVRRPRSKQQLPYYSSGAFWALFYAVIVVEFVAIYLLIRVFQAHHVDNVTFPLIVLVVGLHFYPLAYLNRNTIWYYAATVLSVTMLALVLLVDNDATTTVLGAPHSSTWGLASTGVMVGTMLATSLVSSWLYMRTVPAPKRPSGR